MAVREYIVKICGVFLTAVVSGCCSISVSHDFGDRVKKCSLGGRYSLEDVDDSLAMAIRRYAPSSVVLTDKKDEYSLPLKVSCWEKGKEKETTSDELQAAIACMTIFIIPGFEEHEQEYCVQVKTPIWSETTEFKQIRRDAFSLWPMGLLPFAFPLDGYDFGVDDEYNCLKEEYRTATIAKGLTNAIVKAVISTLAKSRYDEYINNEAQKNRDKLLSMAEQGWPQETLLRDFAIEKSMDIWTAIISLRAEITIQRNRLQTLNDSIKGFGKKPDEDIGYIRCKREYDSARGALVEVFKSLESAYLASIKNNALYRESEAVSKTHKVIEDCARIAIDSVNIIKNKGVNNE